MDSTLDWLSLSLVPGLGLGGAWRLLESFKSPGAILDASDQELLERCQLRKSQSTGLLSGEDWRAKAKHELDRLNTFGAHVISYDSPLYPALLKELCDPPLLLYLLGNPELLQNKAVAMVGSRAATAYGRRTALALAEGLSHYGMCVVSGLAMGIDTEAHRGALAGGGTTVAVLGCGLDIIYPRQNNRLYDEIRKTGAVVSEYRLGTRPEGFRFPARNRIIAGLSRGVVVVEAARRSGSLITAQIALDIGRDVFAVPGQVDSYKSEGAHWLLQQGAKLVMNAADICEEYGVSSSINMEKSTTNELGLDLDPDALALLQLIEPYPETREELVARSKMNPARVSELLLFLELEGVIEMLPGDQLRRV